jgi:integrase
MTHISHKIKNLNLNYEKHFGLKKENNYYKVNPTNNIPEITLLINEETYLPVNVVNSYLINRHLVGKTNSNFECRALRLYFDFLEAIELEWDQGSNYIHKRPLSMFGKYLKQSFEDGDISGTTALNYFNSVSHFYKYYLTEGYDFKESPVTFTQKSIKVFSNSLTNHINSFEVEIDISDCKPNIPNDAKSTELKPFTVEEYELLFDKLKTHSTKDLMLICLLSANTGLRVNEIADLRLDMITSYSNEDVFDLYVGSQVGHKTKGNKNGIIKVSGKIMSLLNKHIESTDYLKRLRKYKNERPPVFITIRGNAFTSQTISVMFSAFVKEYIKSTNPEFNHKFHDLRVHFGVNTMKASLDSDMKKEQALAYVQNQMRHKDIKTTMEYLEYWTHSVVIEKRTALQDSILNDLYNNLDK